MGGNQRPWLGETFLDRTRSSAKSYPPKRHKLWQADSFPAAEYFHFGNFLPWGPRAPGDVRLDTTHELLLRPITGDSQVDCEPDPDGTRQFRLLFLRTVNGGPLEQVPIGSTQFEDISAGQGDYEILGDVVTVGVNEPGNETWIFRAKDLEIGTPGQTVGSIWVEPGGARYWRMVITDNNGAADVAYDNLEFYNEIGGDNIATWGNMDGTNTDPHSAFDEQVGTVRSEVGPPFTDITYTFAEGGPSVLQYKVQCDSGGGTVTTAPKDWTLEYSFDEGSSWTVLHTVSGETNWTSSEIRTYTI